MTARDENINMKGRNMRLRMGASFYVVGLALAVALVQLGLPVALRGFAFVPFFIASILVLQAAYKTCVMRAFKAQRETDVGVERVYASDQLRADRARAWVVLRNAALLAAGATAVLFVVP